MNAAHRIRRFKTRFHGLQDTQALVRQNTVYTRRLGTDVPSAQVHHFARHWYWSCCVDGRVYAGDSANFGPPSAVLRQMEYVYGTTRFTPIKGLQQQDAVSCGLHALMSVTLVMFGVQPMHLNNPEWEEEDVDETLWDWFLLKNRHDIVFPEPFNSCTFDAKNKEELLRERQQQRDIRAPLQAEGSPELIADSNDANDADDADEEQGRGRADACEQGEAGKVERVGHRDDEDSANDNSSVSNNNRREDRSAGDDGDNNLVHRAPNSNENDNEQRGDSSSCQINCNRCHMMRGRRAQHDKENAEESRKAERNKRDSNNSEAEHRDVTANATARYARLTPMVVDSPVPPKLAKRN